MLISLERGLRAMTDAANKMSSQCEIVVKKKGKAKASKEQRTNQRMS